MNKPGEVLLFPDEGRPPSPRRLKRAEQMAHLENLSLFEKCSKHELRRLARTTRQEVVNPGQTIIAEGKPSTHQAYVIIAGRAQVTRGGKKIAKLGPGDIAGELGLLLGRDHTSTVTAQTPLEVLVLRQRDLRQAINEVPGLGWKLLQVVAHRMDENAAGCL